MRKHLAKLQGQRAIAAREVLELVGVAEELQHNIQKAGSSLKVGEACESVFVLQSLEEVLDFDACQQRARHAAKAFSRA